jgi:hypothetical protein
MPDDFDDDRRYRLMRGDNDWRLGDYGSLQDAEDAAWTELERKLTEMNYSDEDAVQHALKGFRVSPLPMVFNPRAQWILCAVENGSRTGDLVYRIKKMKRSP